MTKYTIKVDNDLWKKFKKTITKDRTINNVIVELIKRRINENERGF